MVCVKILIPTFNIPNLINKFLEGNGTGYLSAGLPNIIGTLATPYLRDTPATSYFSGVFQVGDQIGTCCQAGGGKNYKSSFNASRSSSIYGNSSTVQPETCKCYFVIKY